MCYQRMACVSYVLSSRPSPAVSATKCLGGTRPTAIHLAHDYAQHQLRSASVVCKAQNDGGYVRFRFDCVLSRS